MEESEFHIRARELVRTWKPSEIEFKEGQKVRNPKSKYPDHVWTVARVFKAAVNIESFKIGDIWGISINSPKGTPYIVSNEHLHNFIICED